MSGLEVLYNELWGIALAPQMFWSIIYYKAIRSYVEAKNVAMIHDVRYKILKLLPDKEEK